MLATIQLPSILTDKKVKTKIVQLLISSTIFEKNEQLKQDSWSVWAKTFQCIVLLPLKLITLADKEINSEYKGFHRTDNKIIFKVYIQDEYIELWA